MYQNYMLSRRYKTDGSILKRTANSLGQADISASKLKVFIQGLRMNAGIEEHYLILRI